MAMLSCFKQTHLRLTSMVLSYI